LSYAPSDAAIGDLDGDSEYEIVLKREVQPMDPSSSGVCRGSCLLEAYKLNGAFLWRVDLGPNIRQGPHYNPFIVYDLNNDGKAEIAVRTSERTTFGDGTTIDDVDGDNRTYYVDNSGRILEGPEFLSIIEGMTGREIARIDYIARKSKDLWKYYWGDSYGNRMDRFLLCVGHFTSQSGNPSIVMCRGYYKNFQLVALDLQGNKLIKRWHFDTSSSLYKNYIGQGFHNLAVGDVDHDGKDEIVYGASTIDHDGRGLYSTGLGHGDALHLGTINPHIQDSISDLI
jgi:rhamnogalacturonan endolyase